MKPYQLISGKVVRRARNISIFEAVQFQDKFKANRPFSPAAYSRVQVQKQTLEPLIHAFEIKGSQYYSVSRQLLDNILPYEMEFLRAVNGFVKLHDTLDDDLGMDFWWDVQNHVFITKDKEASKGVLGWIENT